MDSIDSKPYSIKKNNNSGSPDYYKFDWTVNNKEGHDYLFPIINDDKTIPKFLYDTKAEIQQENFNKLVEHNIKKVLGYVNWKKEKTA